MNKSIVMKTITTAYTNQEVAELMAGDKRGSANVVIEYKTDAEAEKKARQFKRLAQDPSFDLKITFKKLETCN
jgi:Na+-transporting NADH:ubiquinone oxidoreductase subunit NqrA